MDDHKVDQRLKEIEEEIVLLSGYLSEAVDKKIGTRIGDIKDSLEKIQKSGVGISKGVDVFPGLEKELAGLQGNLGKIVKTIGGDEYKTEDDNLTRRLETISGTILKGVVNLDSNMQGTARKNIENQEKLKKTLIQNLDKLNATIENIKQICTIDKEKTLGREVGLISNKVELLSEKIPGVSETIIKELGSFEKNVQDTVGKNAVKQDEMKKILLENLNKLHETIKAVEQMCITENEETLGREITVIRDRVEKLSEELPDISVSLKADIDKNMQDAFGQNAVKRDEVKELLQRDINKVYDNTEAIRRMCTTDEEKYMGSLVTLISNGVNELTEQIPDIFNNIKQLLGTVDKNMRYFSTQNTTKQDEVKKILLYDLDKINETTEAIQNICTTDDEILLGSQVTIVGNRVEKLSEEVPEIMEKVRNHSDQLNRISSEIKRMRWFVISAAAISLIVLIASFFN